MNALESTASSTNQNLRANETAFRRRCVYCDALKVISGALQEAANVRDPNHSFRGRSLDVRFANANLQSNFVITYFVAMPAFEKKFTNDLEGHVTSTEQPNENQRTNRCATGLSQAVCFKHWGWTKRELIVHLQVEAHGAQKWTQPILNSLGKATQHAIQLSSPNIKDVNWSSPRSIYLIPRL
jgi:hypothetical protein